MRSSTSYYYKYVICNFIFALIICLCTVGNNYFCNNYAFATNLQNQEQNTEISDDLQQNVQETIDNMDLSAIEEYFNNNADYFYNVFGVTDYKQFLYSLVSGELLTNFSSVFDAITNSIKQNFKNILSPLLLILVIVLIGVVFRNIRPKVADDSVSEAIFFICFSVIVTIVVYLVGGVFVQIKNTMQKMQSQMDGILPVLLTLMNASGASISVKAYNPVVLLLSNLISNIFLNVLFGICVVVFVLGLVGGISPKTKVKKLSDFFNSAFKWVIGIVFTVYMAFMSVQGITASSADGISIKTAKYAIKNYIPMLGGYISDGFEVARVGSHIIKNAVGFSGIIILVLTMLSPLLIICVMQLGFKLIAGLIEPLSDSRTSAIFDASCKSLSMLTVVLIGVSCMYFIIMFLLICCASGGL